MQEARNKELRHFATEIAGVRLKQRGLWAHHLNQFSHFQPGTLKMKPEVVEDIVIVGAGLAGLTTSLGLHRLGISSVILESADTLRMEGYALSLWTNAWKALDAVGVGNNLRATHTQLTRVVNTTLNSGLPTAELTVDGDREVWRINRKMLVETLKNELPEGTIRYSSKVVHIQQDDSDSFCKTVHLADGTTLKTKLLIGCDGVNSVVAKYLGFQKPSLAGRGSIRGYIEFEDGHGFEPAFLQSFGNGVRYGVTPCNDHGVNWFLTYTPSPQDEGMQEDGVKMKQFVLSKLGKASNKVKALFENTDANMMSCSQLKFRHPWELFWGNICKDNVCVAGDALHPMTPDIGQGGCSSLEDGVVLARVIAQALLPTVETAGYGENGGQEELNQQQQQSRIKAGLEKYAEDRRWRIIKLVTAAYMVGYIQQKDGVVFSFLRDKLLPTPLAAMLLWMSDFDCGNLHTPNPSSSSCTSRCPPLIGILI